MTAQKTKYPGRGAGEAGPPAGPPEEVVDRLAGLLPAEELERALEGLEPERVTGPDGLVSQLAGRVIETALGAELTEIQHSEPWQLLLVHSGRLRLDL